MPTNTIISAHFLSNLVTSDNFLSSSPVKDPALLFPLFGEKLSRSIAAFNKKYPGIEVVFVETYRSNTLQLIHYNNGASKIKKDGMHHFGIAADLAFKINGVFSYKGDYTYLRQCHANQGLNLIGAWDIGHVQYIPVSEQSALRLTVNNAVIKFQKFYDLKPDGIIGSKTIAKAKEIFLK